MATAQYNCLADDVRLRELASDFDATGWALELVDPEWRLVWVSEQLRALLRIGPEDDAGIGRHYLETRTLPRWRVASRDSQIRWREVMLPYLIEGTPGGHQALRPILPERFREEFDRTQPEVPPPVWTSWMDLTFDPGLGPSRVTYLGIRLQTQGGEHLGYLIAYGSRLPATIGRLVERGDVGMFERMARLREPGRRPAAVLFADLEASGPLSRRLPSAVYFRLISCLTSAIDAAIVEGQGIVGKHAGDGVTAFFLADDLGSRSRACRSALEAARVIERAAAEAVVTAEAEQLLDPGELKMNIGVHWGGALYLGQVVTDGRLEVTALGDEVNEAARIQQSARGGAVYASKSLVERLEPGDADALGLDPDGLLYRTLGELPGATDKALRDAATLAVADVRAEA